MISDPYHNMSCSETLTHLTFILHTAHTISHPFALHLINLKITFNHSHHLKASQWEIPKSSSVKDLISQFQLVYRNLKTGVTEESHNYMPRYKAENYQMCFLSKLNLFVFWQNEDINPKVRSWRICQFISDMVQYRKWHCGSKILKVTRWKVDDTDIWKCMQFGCGY